MDESDKAQLDAAVRHLQNAVLAARECLLDTDAPQEAEVLQIHVNFVVQRIQALEKAVTIINRRHKENPIEVPEDVETAAILVRDLQIKQAQILRERKERERQDLAAQQQKTAQTSDSVQVVIKKPPLPPLPIPRFAGDALEYSNFITIFDATVDGNDTLSDSQKLAYLQSYLDGEPKKLVAKLLIADANYAVARDILKANFGHSSQTISVLYDRLHAVERARNEPYCIRETHNEVEAILQMLENVGVKVNDDKYLRYEVFRKWPFQLVKQIVKNTDMPLEAFREELKKEVELQMQLTLVSGYAQTQAKKNVQPTPAVKPYERTNPARSGVTQTERAAVPPSEAEATPAAPAVQVAMPERSARCPFCEEGHFAEQCERFKTAAQRAEKLGTNRCKKCLRMAHNDTPCIRNIKCRYCPSWDHNRALCPIKYPEMDAKIDPKADAKVLLTEEIQQNDPTGYFMTFLTEVINPQTDTKVEIRVLVDPACNRTALTKSAAQKLGSALPKLSAERTRGMGERQVEPISREAIKIMLLNGEKEPIEMQARLTEKIADDVPVYSIAEFRKKFPGYEHCGIPATGAGQPIDLIIGTDRLLKILTLHKSLYVAETCQLMSTRFGWLIMMESSELEPANGEAISFLTKTEDVVKLMWELDLIGLKPLEEPEAEYEERALKIFYQSLKMVNGRYEVHWPWRSYPPNLSENFGLAMGRLRTLLKKLAENSELLKAYDGIIQQQIQEGIVEDVPKQKELQGAVVHYIPHHAVVMLEKSTPVRIVMDAKSAMGQAKSLNQNILKGTKWLGNIVGSIVRFRRYKKAVTSDVRRAFHQISIAPKDRDAVRFVWVHDITKPPVGDNLRILRFTRVAFGVVASPFLLYATIQFHLKKNPTQYTDIIAKEMYADNLLASLPEETNAVEFYETTKKLFGSMSMDITKWKTNDAELCQHIPNEDKLAETEVSTLGLSWNSGNDTLGLRYPKIAELITQTPTKRSILKIMASIYDPLGWTAPFTLLIRKLIRKLWLEKKQWDSPLGACHLEEWQTYVNEIKTISEVKVARMLFTHEINEEKMDYEMHTFVDASAEALGCVSYLRSVSNEPQIALLMAKSRLTPNTKMTIPRLEFAALLLGIRLQRYLGEAIGLKRRIKRYIWSDSKCVLSWVTTSKLTPLAVSRYLPEIRAAGIDQFRYVPTGKNPADVASRGTLLSELANQRWIGGPRWLKEEQDWPEHIEITYEQEEELQVEKVLFVQNQKSIPVASPFFLELEKFSSLKQLLRRTAYCVWLLNLIMKKEVIKVQTPIDYNRARMLWVRWDQRKNGSDDPEIVRLISHFKNVEIFQDQFGVTRCKSRMENSKLPWTAVQPVVLVKGSYLTEMIILDIHQRNFHSGTAHTLATLRKNYWLVHGRREVYRIIHNKCIRCRTHYAKPYVAPVTPPLPPFRIVPTSYPFENTGLDVYGPIYIFVEDNEKKEYRKEKRWVLLLTCLVIRAIHLEVLVGLDTMDIICAIKRFTARRGTPALILSDNAPQFHLVNGCLQELWKKFFEDNRSNAYFAEIEVQWKFTPQSAPWMGGAYERLVQVTKNSFKKTYGEQTLTEREFITTITEIEGVINSRPITYVDKETDTPLLTPNHFLRVVTPAIPIDISERHQHILSKRENILRYWKAAEESLNVYWRLWSEQYLLALREIKHRHTGEHPSPKVGEVVLMIDPTQRRGYWRKAIVERLIPSADGRCRSAQIRLATGNRMIRPITKLASLELLDVVPEEFQSSIPTQQIADQQSSEPTEMDGRRTAPIVLFAGSFISKNNKRLF